MTDARIALDTFLALCLMEGLAKPIAVRVTRWILARVDRVAPWIPDWLHGGRNG
ncbi:MAG: hypothetical protein VKO65_01755 [Cyanobacteriota bacterium]|nr:hypothetical protein [Cyanobacteriota bacterium]